MKQTLLILLLLSKLLIGEEPLTDWRTWTSLQGTSMEARLLEIQKPPNHKEGFDNVKVLLEFRNGTKKLVLLALLSEPDLEIVTKLDEEQRTLSGEEQTHLQSMDKGVTFTQVHYEKPEYEYLHDPTYQRNERKMKYPSLNTSFIFPPPKNWQGDRLDIPSRGHNDDDLDSKNLPLANHIAWLAKNDLADLSSSSDPDRIWKKITRLDFGNIHSALLDAKVPLKQYALHSFEPTIKSLQESVQGANLVSAFLRETKDEQRGKSYFIQILTAENEELIFLHEGRQYTAKLKTEEIFSEREPLNIGVSFSPEDQSPLVRQIRERGVTKLWVDYFSLYSFQFHEK